MPRDLPGLYWDEEKKRYFPASSRPAGNPPPPPPTTSELEAGTLTQNRPRHNRRQRSHRSSSESPPPKRRQHNPDELRTGNLWQTWNSLRDSPLSVRRRGCVHEMQMLSLSNSTSNIQDVPTSFDGPVTALCLKVSENDRTLLIGDNTGWLYSMDPDDPIAVTREFGLRTQITSITRSGTVCMVTSLGSPPRLLVTRDDSIGLWVVREIPPSLCSDVWCGQIWERKAIFGGKKAIMCFPDIERDEYVKLHRKSDVLSLCLQDQNISFMGLRNGVIDRWDLRESAGKTDVIVNMSATASGDRVGAASVDYLRVIHDHELLVRTMRGDLETHDLRFIRNTTPHVQFGGHVPSYESKLGLAVDPGENFLFAGGGDSRLRIWSLRTGQRVPTHGADLPVSIEGRVARPSQPIRAMEIVENDRGTSLWVACHKELSRIDLGPRGLLS